MRAKFRRTLVATFFVALCGLLCAQSMVSAMNSIEHAAGRDHAASAGLFVFIDHHDDADYGDVDHGGPLHDEAHHDDVDHEADDSNGQQPQHHHHHGDLPQLALLTCESAGLVALAKSECAFVRPDDQRSSRVAGGLYRPPRASATTV